MAAGTWPTTIYPAKVEISSVDSTLVSRAHSGKVQARDRGAQAWRLRLIYPAMTLENAEEIFAFACSMRGQYDTCLVVPGYHLKDARGNMSGSPTATGAAGDSELVISGGSGSFNIGDYVKSASHSKVYKMVEAGGSGTRTITPNLMSAASGALTYDDVTFTCRLLTDLASMSVSVAGHGGFTVELIEDI